MSNDRRASSVERQASTNKDKDSLDARRSTLDASLSFCVRCGNCKALCPTYMEEPTEGMSARGRLMLLKGLAGGEIEPSRTLDERIFSCLLCGACNSVCPLGINITDAVYRYRKDHKGANRKRRFISLGAKLAVKNAAASVKLLKLIEGVAEVFPVYRFKPFRMLRDIGIGPLDAPLRDSSSIFKVSRPRGRIAVFAGCTANFLYPGIGRSLIRSLNALNYEVILPKGEACCGAPLMGLGLEEDAVRLAERNMMTFKRMKVEAVIGLCPTCVHFIKDEYKRLVGDGIENAVEVSQFFGDKLQTFDSNKLKGKGNKESLLVTRDSSLVTDVVYHDPCHSVYGLKVSAEPRAILRAMGLNLLDAERGCCGFGGTFRLLYQDLSESILQKRVEEYRKADMVVTSCPNCMIQLRSRLKDRQVKHIAELIEQAVQGDRHGKER